MAIADDTRFVQRSVTLNLRVPKQYEQDEHLKALFERRFLTVLGSAVAGLESALWEHGVKVEWSK